MRAIVFTALCALISFSDTAVAPLGAGGGTPRTAAQSPAQMADAARVVTPALILGHVKALSADDKEGRAPGTVGEERTVAYLVSQFKRLGLAPGNPDGTYVQRVPLIAFTGAPTAAFDVKGNHILLAILDEAVVVSR